MAVALDPAAERQVAVDLFNFVWTLIEKPDRSRADDNEMLHAAHASRYHWGRVGSAENLDRGEWQVSRVYCVLGRAEPALYHAQRCLEYCVEHGIGDWDLAFAYEALARAALVVGDLEACRSYLAQARTAGEDIQDQEDREQFDKELATIRI